LVLTESDFGDSTGVDEGVEAKDVGGLLVGEDGGDVEEEALGGGIVESHLDNGRVGDDEVLVSPEVVDLASGGLGVLYAF